MESALKRIWRITFALAFCLVSLFVSSARPALATSYPWHGWFTTPNAWYQFQATVTLDSYNADIASVSFANLGAVSPAETPTTGVNNGSFQYGSLGGWTTSGSTSLITGGYDTGNDNYAAQAGVTTQHTAQDSSLVQNFYADPIANTLQFYYEGHCRNNLYGGYATATLKDITTNTTYTILPQTCTNSPSWNLVSKSITPYHEYTLTMTNHDDGYGGLNPNWTYFDNVHVLNG